MATEDRIQTAITGATTALVRWIVEPFGTGDPRRDRRKRSSRRGSLRRPAVPNPSEASRSLQVWSRDGLADTAHDVTHHLLGWEKSRVSP